MTAKSDSTVRRLRRHQSLRLNHPRRLCVRVERGHVWITVDGQADDIVLGAGERRLFDGRIKVLISTLGADAVLSITPVARPAAAPSRRARWPAWLGALPRLAVAS